ncbi:MAG: aldehyde dehydrogenase family protein, partial [Planctomycetota bacterium]
MTSAIDPKALLASLGVRPDADGTYRGTYAGEWIATSGPVLDVECPATGETIGRVKQATAAEYDRAVDAAHEAFLRWRSVPAPVRGEYVRKIGMRLREHKDALGTLVTLEMGKILQEGLGEVQEAIDIADFAVGQSRMLYGLSMHSERPGHSMKEQWHPLGVVGIVSAFNFPSAVWAWNSMLALICGDACVWKPSPKVPLTAIAMTEVCRGVLEEGGFGALLTLVVGGNEEVGQRLIDDKRLPLVSFTGSCKVGGMAAGRVAARFGHTILELGGNNAIVVTENADLDLAIP